MTDRLRDKIVAITGAGGGLGRAFARRLADGGASIAVMDINGAAADDVVRDLGEGGCRAIAVAVDVTHKDQVDASIRKIHDALGAIDVLVNNAGGALYPPTAFEQVGAEQWSRVLAVNLTGAWFCAQAVVPAMKRARHGRIINVSSTVVSQGYPVNMSAYITAKAGIVGLTRALARELGPHGVTVNAIAPGLVPHKRPATAEGAALIKDLMELVVSRQALPRVGAPQDLCGAVEFLASDDSAFVTGQVLNVDGGWAMA